MNQPSDNTETDDKMAPYRYLQDPGVHSFEELDEFKDEVPRLQIHTNRCYFCTSRLRETRSSHI